jgi:hypothetical protein
MGELASIYGEQGFQAGEQEPMQDMGSLLPIGWLAVGIDKAEIKPTKGGDGKYLAVDFVLIGEVQKGRHAFNNFNIQNPNQQAMDIAQRELGALSVACGIPILRDEEELIGCMLMIRNRISPAAKNKSGKDENAVAAYAVSGAHPEVVLTQATAPVQQTAPPPAQQQANTAVQNPAPTAVGTQPAFVPPVPAPATGAKKRPWEK